LKQRLQARRGLARLSARSFPVHTMDMLINLYPPQDRGWAPPHHLPGIEVRQPIAPEQDRLVAWVAGQFGPGWASEARAAMAQRPTGLFMAVREQAVLGFCCCDTTARGFIGPIGVAAEARGGGLGAALLHAGLHHMRTLGYGYAVAGAVGAPGFFRRVAGAVEIEGSTPGIYRGLLKA
jgi:GNAT superfamily N-acetyltransferase